MALGNNCPFFISWHFTYNATVANIRGHIIINKAAAYSAMAQAAPGLRMYGAIYYWSDYEKGLDTGKKIGNFTIARAGADGAKYMETLTIPVNAALIIRRIHAQAGIKIYVL